MRFNKAKQILRKLEAGEKVSRWEVFPYRYELKQLTRGTKWENDILILIDEALASL